MRPTRSINSIRNNKLVPNIFTTVPHPSFPTESRARVKRGHTHATVPPYPSNANNKCGDPSIAYSTPYQTTKQEQDIKLHKHKNMAFSQLVQFAMGLASNPSQGNIATQAQSNTTFLSPLPAAYIDVSAVLLRDNLAVIPGEWDSGGISRSFLHDLPCFAQGIISHDHQYQYQYHSSLLLLFL